MKIVCMFVVKNRLLKNVSHRWKYWCSYLVLKIVLSMLYLKLIMINKKKQLKSITLVVGNELTL